MKNLLLILSLTFLFTAFKKPVEISSIYGSFEPPGSVNKVSAINGTDTVVVIPQQGKFSIAVHGGIWKLHIEAIPPYLDITTEYFKVTEGFSTDVGVVRLSKQIVKAQGKDY